MRLANLLKLGAAILLAFGSIAGGLQNRPVLAEFHVKEVHPILSQKAFPADVTPLGRP